MKQLMENWRRLIKESEVEDEVPQPLPLGEVPEELYHATRPPLLSKISIDGLRDFTDFSRHGAGQHGVSFTTQLEAVSSGEFGKLILVYDGLKLAESGQFHFKPHQDPTIGTKESEIRVEMIDSASETGSGIDEKVDALGTEVPFSYVKKMIFLYPLQEQEQEWLKEKFPNIPFESYDRRTGEILEYDEKEEETLENPEDSEKSVQ
jgi:hypothetical protein